MSDKIALPDELLDAIAGGKLTYQGISIEGMSATGKGCTARLSDGSEVKLEWTDKTRYEDLYAHGFSTFLNKMVSLMVDRQEYKMEDFVK